MKVLGVDPGLRITGYGLIESSATKIKLLEAGIIEPKEKDLIQNRINAIYNNLDELVTEYRPEVMVLGAPRRPGWFLDAGRADPRGGRVGGLLCARHRI